MKLKSSITLHYCLQSQESSSDKMPFLTSSSLLSSNNNRAMKSCKHRRHNHHLFTCLSSLAITCCLLFPVMLLFLPSSFVLGKTTPEPPIFYDCEDEGFFPHPKDCRKYFWCLDSGPANLGIVPHAFTCPSGLYFSTKTEGCDYPANVPCANAPKNKTVLSRTRSRSGKKTTTTTTVSPVNDVEDDEIVLTTLSPTTTEAPTTLPTTTTKKPSKGPERLLKEAGVTSSRNRKTQKQSSSQPSSAASSTSSSTSSGDDNLKQLLQLVQSLGGVERIKSLVDKEESRLLSTSNLGHNKNDQENLSGNLSPSSSSRSHQRVNSRLHNIQSTPPPLFSPSYETPKRPEPTTTETPTNVLNNNDNNVNSNVIRHRRPQSSLLTNLQSESLSPVTVNPFQSYADPSRGTSLPPQDEIAPFVSSRRPNNHNHINNYEEENSNAFNNEALVNQNSNLNQNNNNFYSFAYHTPGSRVSVQTGLSSQSFVPLSSSSLNNHGDNNGNLDNNKNNNDHRHASLTDDALHVTRPAPISLPLTSSFSDPFFTYNTPGRFETSAPQTTTAVTEATPFVRDVEPPRRPEQNFARETNRLQSPRNEGTGGGFVRVRVNPSSSAANFRFPEGNPTPSSGRRATRVRIANPSQINPGNLINHQPSSLSSQTLPPLRNSRLQTQGHNHLNNHRNVVPGNQPGVLYDEEATGHHNFAATDAAPLDLITTRKPVRRRPPQREHLRSRQEANPVGALVNLPPPNLQVEPLPQVGGDRGLPRPFPPKPQNPPRILPIAVPLVNLPRDIRLPAMINQQDQRQPAFPQGFTPDPNLRPGTVRYNNLGLSSPQPVDTQSSPRPAGFDDNYFATDFPFFGDLPERPNFQNDNRDPELPNTFSPTVFSSVATTTLTTTTTTTPSPRPPSEPTTAFADVSTRRQRGRGRTRTTPSVTLPSFNTTPRPSNRGRERSRAEVTTPRPTPRPTTPHVAASAPAIDDEGATIPSGPAVEMDSGSVKCTRRGVFAHPGSCGQFVVCAPVSRGSLNYRSYLHHCPAEQVFVEEVGRCRPGNKERCEVFTK